MVRGKRLPNTPLVYLVVIAIATGYNRVGTGWLERPAEHLSAYYGLPAAVQGSVVVAAGPSFSEPASVVFTALSGTFDVSVGAVVGTAIFNILFISVVAGIATREPIGSSRTVDYGESQPHYFWLSLIDVLAVGGGR